MQIFLGIAETKNSKYLIINCLIRSELKPNGSTQFKKGPLKNLETYLKPSNYPTQGYLNRFLIQNLFF